MDYVPRTRARAGSRRKVSLNLGGAGPRSRAAYWRIGTAMPGLLPLRFVCKRRACYATRGYWASWRARRVRLPRTRRPEPLREPLLPEEEKVDDDAAAAPGP